jgi:hypothetical protein
MEMENENASDAWEAKSLNWLLSYTVLCYQNASSDPPHSHIKKTYAKN